MNNINKPFLLVLSVLVFTSQYSHANSTWQPKCFVQSVSHNYKRPTLHWDLVWKDPKWVAKNGMIERLDLQRAIDQASALSKTNGKIYKVEVPAGTTNLDLSDTYIQVKSGVVVDLKKTVVGAKWRDKPLNFLFYIADNANNAAITNGRFVSRRRLITSYMRIGNAATNIKIYDNDFVGDNTPEEIEEKSLGDGIPAVDLGDNVSNLIIDSNNFYRNSTAIAIRREGINQIFITHNWFYGYRSRAIFVLGQKNPTRHVKILNNTIAPPGNGNIRQPIIFQNAIGTYHKDLEIADNFIWNYDEPYVHDFEDQAYASQFVYLGSFSTRGTADNISVHKVDGFTIQRNCIYNAGELGINASQGAKNGLITNNYVSRADISGIGIGCHFDRVGEYNYFTQNIRVIGNHIYDSGINRNQEPIRWAIAGVHTVYTKNITIEQNTIHTTNRFDPMYSTPFGIKSMAADGLIIQNNRIHLTRPDAQPIDIQVDARILQEQRTR